MGQDKRVRWDWDFIQNTGGQNELYELSPKNQQLFLTAIAVAAWKTRWINSPNQFGEIDDFVAQSTEAITIPVDYCQKILDCINDPSSGVESGIKDVFSGVNGAGGDYGAGANSTIQSQTDSSNMLADADCSNDNQFAIAVGITDFIFESVKQLFDVLRVITAPEDLVSEVTDNLPAVATAAISTGLDYALWLRDTADALFDAFDTPQKRDEIACELFCIMQRNNCELSFDDMFEHFSKSSALPIAGNTLESILQNIVSLSAVNLVGNTMIAVLFGFLAVGSRFSGIKNIGVLLARIYAFKDDTNNNWNQLCDDCGDCYLLDFSVSSYGFFLDQDVSGNPGAQQMGTYTGGAWESTYISYDSVDLRGVAIKANISATNIQRLEMDFDINPGINAQIGIDDGSNRTIVNVSAGSNQTITHTVNAVESTLYAALVVSSTGNNANTDPGGNGAIKRIRIYYTGTPPDIGVPCP